MNKEGGGGGYPSLPAREPPDAHTYHIMIKTVYKTTCKNITMIINIAVATDT